MTNQELIRSVKNGLRDLAPLVNGLIGARGEMSNSTCETMWALNSAIGTARYCASALFTAQRADDIARELDGGDA